MRRRPPRETAVGQHPLIASKGRDGHAQPAAQDAANSPGPKAEHGSAGGDDDSTKAARREREVVTERWGMWEVEREIVRWRDWLPFATLATDLAEVKAALPFVFRFLRELWSIGPHLTLAYLVLRFVQAALPAIKIKSRSAALKMAQEAVNTRDVELSAIVWVFASQAGILLLGRCINWLQHRVTQNLSSRLRRIFEVHTMKARFKLDLPSLEDENTKRELVLIGGRMGSHRAWRALQDIVNAGADLLETATSFALLLNLLREQRGDRLIAFAALLKPVLDATLTEGLHGNFWARIVDPLAKRADDLRLLSTKAKFYKDIISFSLGDYITSQYIEAVDHVNAENATHFVSSPYDHQRSPFAIGSVLRDIAEDLPLAVFAWHAVSTPLNVPLSFVNYQLIKQTTADFSRRVLMMSRGGSGQSGLALARHAGMIRTVYEAINLPVKMQDGLVEYERADTSAGMHIELKAVSFGYPGSLKPVLHDVSCHFPRGGLTIIVGMNGSGKTTLMKLLNRMYDTTGGDVLINGRSIRDYRIESVRQATASLWQDHQVVPLSIGENIAMGDVHSPPDAAAIRRAAERAGCLEFIEEMPMGFDTYMGLPDLGSGRLRSSGLSSSIRPALLQKRDEQQNRQVQLSGGQLQKLALARVLMREEKADLLLFDEPSASLDPAAERDLFLRTKALRGKKTIIWVTHRVFLAKSADWVIMMEKGTIKEQGTPEQLLQAGGQFKELYDFQS